MQEILLHPIPAVIVLLGLLVTIHEAGHFIVGRLCGIAVDTFSIGFGPPIVKFTRGHTQYRLSWIPLGGYVKFFGMTPRDDVPPSALGHEYFRQPVWKRLAMVAAGPGANMFLAVVVFTLLGVLGVEYPPAVIGDVLPAGRAEEAGILPGDVVEGIEDQSIKTWSELERLIMKSAEKQLALRINRGGQPITIQVTPAAVEAQSIFGSRETMGRIGIALGFVPPILAIVKAESPLAAGGLKTGDQILAVVDPERGTQRQVRSFAEFLKELALLQREGRDSIKIRYQSWKGEGSQAGSYGPEELEAAVRLDRNMPPVELKLKDLRVLADALGITDGQLVVGETQGPVRGVLQPGDRILQWEDRPLKTIFDLREILIENQRSKARLVLGRGYKVQELLVDLQPVDVQKPSGRETLYMLPVGFLGQAQEPMTMIESYSSLPGALGYGLKETTRQTQVLVGGLVRLVTGHIPLKAIGGPILIAKVAGDSAKAGLQAFLTSMALISINLALVNLFPIPILDGGQIVLLLAEGFRRRPLSDGAVENLQKLGFAMIMSLIILAMYNDMSRFWKSMVQSVMGNGP